MSKEILKIASEVQDYLNNGYDYFAKKFCNITKHRLSSLLSNYINSVHGVLIPDL